MKATMLALRNVLVAKAPGRAMGASSRPPGTNREHETNAPVASNSYGQFPNWRAWRKGDVLRSWQKITLGEDYGTVPARRDHRDACRRLRYGRAASPCRCRRDQDADQGCHGMSRTRGFVSRGHGA